MEELLANYLSSLLRVVVGFAAAVCLGIPAGLLRSQLPWWIRENVVITFVLDASRFWAPISLIPAVIVYFGVNEFSSCLIIFYGGFWQIMVGTYRAAETVPQSIRDTGHSLQLKRGRYLWQVIFPAALPGIFTALELGLGTACGALVAAEMIGRQTGLGYSITLNYTLLEFGEMWKFIFLTGTVGCVILLIILVIKKWLVPWDQKYINRGRP